MADWFLSLFDPDPIEAQRRCEILRAKLTFFFQHRLIAEPDERAQEVFARVLQKRPELATHVDLVRFCFGVARNIVMEVRRERPSEELPSEIDQNTYFSDPVSDPEKLLLVKERRRLIRTCLKSLEADDLELLVSWYLGEEDAHKKLASRLGISGNALRIRRHRLGHRVQEMFRRKGLR